MKAWIRGLAVAAALACGGIGLAAQAQPKLSEGQKKIQALQRELDALDRAGDDLAKDMAQIEFAGRALKARTEAGKTAAAILATKAQDHSVRTSILSNRVAAHNSRCRGTFDDRDFVARCNSEADALNAEGAVLNKEADQIDRMTQEVRTGRDRITQDTLIWTRRSKEADARYEQWKLDQAALDLRLRNILNDLKKRAAMSKECKDLAEKGGEVKLEMAHRCLQQVWDGAK
jgi:hypothetical protein